MIITKEINGTEMEICLEGRLDTVTAPGLENEIKADISGVNDIVFDMEKLEYISSAGLRVLLSAQKGLENRGKVTLKNVCEAVKDVLDITGFADILTII